MSDLTTFIIPTIGRDTLNRAVNSVENIPNSSYKVGFDDNRIGASEIRNELISQSDTEWVSFLDDDDSVTSDYVQRLEEELQKNPYADVVVFREYFIGELMGEQNKYPDHFIWTAPIVHWGQIGIAFSVKRDVALKHPFVEEPNEDYHFVARLDEQGYNIHFSKYIVYRARH